MQPKIPPSPVTTPPARDRLTIDVTPDILVLLDHISATTGMSRTAVALMILANGLVGFVDAAQAIKKVSESISKQRK